MRTKVSHITKVSLALKAKTNFFFLSDIGRSYNSVLDDFKSTVFITLAKLD